jgi:hypothetical protein
MAENYQSGAAKRGLDVEKALIECINKRDPQCEWIVEECCESTGYGNFRATKPSNHEKPDVVIYTPEIKNPKKEGLSLKSYKKNVSFCQANRGKLATFAYDLNIPDDVVETLKLFTVKGPNGKRVMLNEAPQQKQQSLLKFFVINQKNIIEHVLKGKLASPIKANWMLFHETIPNDWIKNVGNKKFWRLYSMEVLIKLCCSLQPCFSKQGNLILGIGLTMQRKGGDNGRDTANDLQFKINPVEIISELEKLSNQ